MPAHYLGKPVRYGVGGVGLKRDQRGCANAEVVEVELGHILRIIGIGIGNNSEGAGAGHEAQRGKRRFSTRRVVQVGSRAEEGCPRLVDSGRSDHLGVTYDELLGAGWRLRGEPWHACAVLRQGAEDGRIVKVVIERPVARLAIVEIDALSELVIPNSSSLAIVGIRTCDGIDVGMRNVLDSSNRCWRPGVLGNLAAKEDAHSSLRVRQRIAARSPVWLIVIDRISQPLCEP